MIEWQLEGIPAKARPFVNLLHEHDKVSIIPDINLEQTLKDMRTKAVKSADTHELTVHMCIYMYVYVIRIVMNHSYCCYEKRLTHRDFKLRLNPRMLDKYEFTCVVIIIIINLEKSKLCEPRFYKTLTSTNVR